MASSSTPNHHSSSSFAKSQLKLTIEDDDDDFQNPTPHYSFPLTQTPLKPINRSLHRVSKKQRLSVNYHSVGKENIPPRDFGNEFDPDEDYCSLDAIPSTFDDFRSINRVVNWKETDGIEKKGLDSKRKESCSSNSIESRLLNSEVGGCSNFNEGTFGDFDKKGLELKRKESYLSNSVESRLLNSRLGGCSNFNEGTFGDFDKKGLELKRNESYLSNSVESRLLNSRLGGGSDFNEGTFGDFAPGTQFDLLFQLCAENEADLAGDCVVLCPLCETDISGMTEELRQVHTNNCLDQGEDVRHNDEPGPEISRQAAASSPIRLPGEVVDISPVLDWLANLGLEKYEDYFIREEIDWDTLQWLSEEDLINIGINALGPRKKIVHALNDLRRGTRQVEETCENVHSISDNRRGKNLNRGETRANTSKVAADDIGNLASNKLITDFFPGTGVADKNKVCGRNDPKSVSGQDPSETCQKRGVKRPATNKKARDVPLWCCVPGTPFRVDAFKFLRRDCSHWFLTHFHIDHYQGLTRSFSHGTIYCSLVTAKLVNLKIGIPWDKLQVLPLDQKINIAGINVTCFDANHCPGSIMILFEPPNDKAILHTGDFRFSETMPSLGVLQSHPIHSLILDTTYCNPQYDFPKQEDVIQFVIEAIQAEAFNPKTLFLIGSYTIGKERLFLEVARVLRKKVYVNASKLRIMKCLGFSEEDMQWFTLNEQESHIHVVPMWTLASFKRLKHVSNQYSGRYNLIVAFSPTGWTFGKGKKKCPGRRWQQGTLIRYEVPYSEHSSFTELREFVKYVSPANIIPSVNNDGPEFADNMVALLTS